MITNMFFRVLSCSGNKQWKLFDDTGCLDEARTRHHSALSPLDGGASHSTDQPGGRVQGQVKLAIISSKVSPENEPQARLSILILSKTYPSSGIYSTDSRHARLFGSGVCFAEKHLQVGPYFQLLAQDSSFINHSR